VLGLDIALLVSLSCACSSWNIQSIWLQPVQCLCV